MGRRKRRRVDPAHEWERIELLCVWDEQRDYERIRPLVLFREPVPERAAETGTSERTLNRRVAAFRDGGMESLFESPKAKRRVLPPAIRRKEYAARTRRRTGALQQPLFPYLEAL